MEEVDRALQDFQYSFECASSRRERLRFCTLRTSGSLDELGEILSVYGDRDVIFQTNGTEHVAKTVEDAESIQRCLRDRITLTAGKKSVRWKLYYTADLHANKSSEEFVGFVGLSLLESTKLEPHIRLRSDYHNQGIGRKAMICLMAKLFSNKPWLYSNVSGLFMSIHPMNKECIILKNKLLLREVSEHKNPKHADGLWVETFKLWKDRREATIPLRHFVCNSMRSLESIFLSVLNVNVNKADTLLLSRSNYLVCPEKVACPAQSKEVERLVADGYDHIDATLQNFEYTFDYGSRCEKLSFHTFKKPGSRFELEEILSLFSDVESMRYYGSEIPIQRTLAEARRWREQLRKKNSFAGEMKGFIWKVSYSADIHNSASKPSFIGFVSLSHRKISRVLSPAILLKSEYRNRGCGSKAFLCLLVRLLSKRAWFAQHFDGICMMINPENVASLALQDKVMLGFTKEKENDRRADGLWVFTRKAYCDDRVKNVTRRLFECRGVAVLESLLRAKFSSQRVNKKEMLLLADDRGGKRQITASMLDLSNKLSLHQIQLYVEDVQRLVLDLNWFKLRLMQTAPKSVVNTFSLVLPEDLCIETGDSSTFFLLFFLENLQLQAFTATKLGRSRIHVSQGFLAFHQKFNASEDIVDRTFKLSMVQDSQESIIGYLLELRFDSFETKDAEFDLQKCLTRIWSTGHFTYCRRKRRRWPNEHANEVVLKKSELSFCTC